MIERQWALIFRKFILYDAYHHAYIDIFYSDTGMRFLVGDNWKDYFDVVIVQARKPKFFTEESRPLRIYDEVNKTQLWDRVTKLEKGVIYLEVWLNFSVLFFHYFTHFSMFKG